MFHWTEVVVDLVRRASGLLERSEATVGGGAAGTNPAAWLHEGWSNSSSKRGGKRSTQPATVDEDAGATRVLPVFVFSLLGLHPSLMLDAKSLVHASDHSVVVLQTNNSRMPIPFYADGDGTLSISMTTPTPHVLAGLAMSLGALVAPFESFGRRDGGAVQRDWRETRHARRRAADASTVVVVAELVGPAVSKALDRPIFGEDDTRVTRASGDGDRRSPAQVDGGQVGHGD